MKPTKNPFLEAQEAAIKAAGDEFKTVYKFHFAEYLSTLKQGDLFSGDQAHQFIKTRLPKEKMPASSNVWGASFGASVRPLLKHGILSVDGYAPSLNQRNHGHPYKVYKRQI